MKYLLLVVFFLAVSCSFSTASVAPDLGDIQHSLVPIHRQELDIFSSSRRLIEQLIQTLQRAARDAYDAVGRFNTNIQEEVKTIRDKVANDIQRLRDRVSNAMEGVRNRLIDSGVAIIDCIASHNSDANALFNETLTKAMSCVDERISEVGEQISGLRTMANNAVEFGNKALGDMKQCTEDGGNFLTVGSCLGSLAVQTEIRSLVFITQGALSISRINLSLATLPASLEVCAGSRLVDAGLKTARVLMDIGTCSATSVFTTMTGNA